MAKLEKLLVYGYKDKDFSQRAGVYALRINPSELSHSHVVAFDSTPPAAGAPGQTTKYNSHSPQQLSFAFYLDATGAIPGINSVVDEIKKFRDVAYRFQGDIHEPSYLNLVWGKTLNFRCRLTKFDIEYTLFAPNGTPLRAKLSVGFAQYLSPKRIAQEGDANSPDLTHVRTVLAGDTLPMMCHRIYGDGKYYLEVARINGLDHFRTLEPGSRITFPPLAR
jgi:nucleoid-associated protein YgaU